MLDSLRQAAGTWIAKLLLMLLVLSFAVWGISGELSQGMGSQTVLRAGDTSIGTTQYRLAYDRQINAILRQTGRQLTREEAKALGVDAMVLGSLVADAVLQEQARKLGLGLSKDRIAELTAQDRAFQGPDGRFDQQQFDYVLRQVGMRPQDYFDDVAKAATRQQIVQAVADGVEAPDAFLRAVALYRGEDRTVDYIVLPTSVVPPVEEPANDVLATWFEANKARYAAPEYRKIDYARLEPEDIMDLSAVTDKQVEDDYAARKNRYTTPETRAVEQIVFPDEEAARAALEAIRGGKTFAQVVQDAGKTPQDTQLGTLTKDRIPDAAIADVAFSLAENQVSDVIQGAFGPALVRVTKINPEVVKPIAELREEIRRELALSEANRVLLDAHDSYEDARAGGATLREAAETLKLKVVTVEVDRQAMRPDGTVVEDIPASAELLEAAFQAQAKVENQGISTRNNGYVFYEVDSITPARDRTLDEVKDKAVADWKAEQLAQRLEAKANEIAKRVTDGATLDAVATEMKLEKQTKRGLKREAEDPDFGGDGVNAAFGVAQNGTGSFVAPDGASRIVFKVVESIEPAAADADSVPENERGGFATALSGDMLDELVSRLRGEYDVEVNQAAIDRALTF